jgi:hypothetical protein
MKKEKTMTTDSTDSTVDPNVIKLAAQLADYFGVTRVIERSRIVHDEQGKRIPVRELPFEERYELIPQSDEDVSNRATTASFIAEDGYRSFRSLTFLEVTEALLGILENKSSE